MLEDGGWEWTRSQNVKQNFARSSQAKKGIYTPKKLLRECMGKQNKNIFVEDWRRKSNRLSLIDKPLIVHEVNLVFDPLSSMFYLKSDAFNNLSETCTIFTLTN